MTLGINKEGISAEVSNHIIIKLINSSFKFRRVVIPKSNIKTIDDCRLLL